MKNKARVFNTVLTPIKYNVRAPYRADFISDHYGSFYGCNRIVDRDWKLNRWITIGNVSILHNSRRNNNYGRITW